MIIKCPECGKDVSSEAKACPFCGYPINKNRKKEVKDNANYHAVWKDVVGVSVSGGAMITLCPILVYFGLKNQNDLLILSGAIGFILLLFPFIICLLNLAKRKR